MRRQLSDSRGLLLWSFVVAGAVAISLMVVVVAYEHAAKARDQIEASELAAVQQGRRCPRTRSAAQTSSRGSANLDIETSDWD